MLEETRRQAYINTLVNNILQNDIENRYSIKYKEAFEQLAQHLLNTAPATKSKIRIRNVYYYGETSGECDFVLYQGKTVCQLIQVSYDKVAIVRDNHHISVVSAYSWLVSQREVHGG